MTLSHSYLDSDNSNSFYKDIVTNFLEEFQKFPFGSMPKRDLDCLIFYLFEKYKLIDGNSNRQKAYNLNISETKFKSYIIDSNAKYSKSNQEENLKIILSKLADETKVSMDGDCLVFVEENPVIKADFVQSLKDEGFYTDSSFNNELVKVKIASFLSFALSKNLADKEKILKIINEAKSEDEKIMNFENSMKNYKDVAKDVLGILKEQDGFGIKTIVDLLYYGKNIVSAKINN